MTVASTEKTFVKMGRDCVAACLAAGVNDLGGTLMNESITRGAGALNGEEMPPEAMEKVIASLGRRPRRRTTLYTDAPAERTVTSFGAARLRQPATTLGSITQSPTLSRKRAADSRRPFR